MAGGALYNLILKSKSSAKDQVFLSITVKHDLFEIVIAFIASSS